MSVGFSNLKAPKTCKKETEGDNWPGGSSPPQKRGSRGSHVGGGRRARGSPRRPYGAAPVASWPPTSAAQASVAAPRRASCSPDSATGYSSAASSTIPAAPPPPASPLHLNLSLSLSKHFFFKDHFLICHHLDYFIPHVFFFTLDASAGWKGRTEKRMRERWRIWEIWGRS